MKIGTISDSHDRIGKVRKAIKLFEDEGISEIIHCGDFTAAFIIKELEEFAGNVHCVFGNIDDKYNTTKFAEQSENVTLHGDFAKIEIDNKKIGIVHKPFLAESMALSNYFDIVFYGHTHKKKKERKGKTLLVNPGELMGRFGETTIAIYDTKKDEVQFREVE